jgi:cold-inducible RNA-binding protein
VAGSLKKAETRRFVWRLLMKTKLHVDNLAEATTERDLRDWFAPHGEVAQVDVLISPGSGRSRRFGFVTMATPEGARLAIEALNGKALGSCNPTVSEAWPHEQHAVSGGGSGGPVVE